MLSYLPLAVWCFSFTLSVIVLVLAILHRAQLKRNEANAFRVDWSVTALHFMSVVAAMGAYLLYIVGNEKISYSMNRLYESFGVFSALLIVFMTAIDITMIVLQARSVQRAQMDRVLKGIAQRNDVR